MKGLTLTQPWATLIALGHKRVETRSFSRAYTGPIAIHAAKGFPRYAVEFARVEHAVGRLPWRIPFGAIVATAVLIGCRLTQDVEFQVGALERHLGDYSWGRYAWFLSDIVALPEPIPCKGMLGLWNVPPDIAAQLPKPPNPAPKAVTKQQ